MNSKRDVLVDTSVWVDFFRRSANPQWRAVLQDLMERDAAIIIDPVIAELLYGTRGERERTVVLDLARSIRRAEVTVDTWIASGDLGRTWRIRGRTLSLVDCILVTVAQRDGLRLWTLDRDFEPLAQESGLDLFQP